MTDSPSQWQAEGGVTDTSGALRPRAERSWPGAEPGAATDTALLPHPEQEARMLSEDGLIWGGLVTFCPTRS